MPGQWHTSPVKQFIQAANDLDPLVTLAVAPCRFEAIHPFADGNGPTGRILNFLLLLQAGLLHHPVLYLSHYIIERRREPTVRRPPGRRLQVPSQEKLDDGRHERQGGRSGDCPALEGFGAFLPFLEQVPGDAKACQSVGLQRHEQYDLGMVRRQVGRGAALCPQPLAQSLSVCSVPLPVADQVRLGVVCLTLRGGDARRRHSRRIERLAPGAEETVEHVERRGCRGEFVLGAGFAPRNIVAGVAAALPGLDEPAQVFLGLLLAHRRYAVPFRAESGRDERV
ncbi:hypothetical protein D6T64_01755 [Cryobacterium melibiosiphilum]|uniref:Fido domain-containing protein n=1 Tax=Cryobacterium melibiosiphilum TaxID=995039 RepID=A0A3A5MQ32_9MICO|nr:hypothetical protein D6T64_01755 [Cryobacterium melibiosiphilum]